MVQEAIFGPFFAMMALTLAVWTYMYVRRIHFIQANRFTPEQMATPGLLADRSPPAVSNPSDNLKNLFEIPVLFYALVLFLFATERVDALHVNTAWVFVGFRTAHSLVHCSFNHVLTRFGLYLGSAVALVFMGIRSAA